MATLNTPFSSKPLDLPIRFTVYPPSSLKTKRGNNEENEKGQVRVHKITITSPETDIFFHWTHVCHAFNFRTLVQRHGWKLPTCSESDLKERCQSNDINNISNTIKHDPYEDSFESFGGIIRDRVRECVNDATRY